MSKVKMDIFNEDLNSDSTKMCYSGNLREEEKYTHQH